MPNSPNKIIVENKDKIPDIKLNINVENNKLENKDKEEKDKIKLNQFVNSFINLAKKISLVLTDDRDKSDKLIYDTKVEKLGKSGSMDHFSSIMKDEKVERRHLTRVKSKNLKDRDKVSSFMFEDTAHMLNLSNGIRNLDDNQIFELGLNMIKRYQYEFADENEKAFYKYNKDFEDTFKTIESVYMNEDNLKRITERMIRQKFKVLQMAKEKKF